MRKSEIAPIIHTDVFRESPESQLAITSFGPERDDELAEGVRTGYHLLRKQVYVDEMQFLDGEAVACDGGEYDHDDERSQHFAVLENQYDGQNAAVIASMRLIAKTHASPAKLPVEEFAPDLFVEGAIPENGVEVSRFITRHRDHSFRRFGRDVLFGGALAHIIGNDLQPTYALVEDNLETHLKRIGVPVERKGDYRWVEEYNSENAVIEIDTRLMAKRFGKYVFERAVSPGNGVEFFTPSFEDRKGSA